MTWEPSAFEALEEQRGYSDGFGGITPPDPRAGKALHPEYWAAHRRGAEEKMRRETQLERQEDA